MIYLQNRLLLQSFRFNHFDVTTSNALSGDQFVSRLQKRGLSKAQAQEVSTVIGKRVAELRTQGEQAVQAASDQAQQVARDAASTAGKAAWIWLLLAGLVLGLASYGGGFGNDTNQNGRLVNTGLEESTRTYRPSRP